MRLPIADMTADTLADCGTYTNKVKVTRFASWRPPTTPAPSCRVPLALHDTGPDTTPAPGEAPLAAAKTTVASVAVTPLLHAAAPLVPLFIAMEMTSCIMAVDGGIVDAVGVMDGVADVDWLPVAVALTDALADAGSELDALIEGDSDGDIVRDGVAEGETLKDGLTVGENETDGNVEGDADADNDAVVENEAVKDALGV